MRDHTDDTLRTLSLFAKAMQEMEKEAPKSQPKPKAGTGGFWVYTNDQRNKAYLHLSTCSYCNHGQGIHPDRSDAHCAWHGPFDEITARDTARSSGKRDIRWCLHCAGKIRMSIRIEPDDI